MIKTEKGLKFEEFENEKYYKYIINSKYGALFLENILDKALNYLKEKPELYNSITNPKNQISNYDGIRFPMGWLDFTRQSKHYINQYMAILQEGNYGTKSMLIKETIFSFSLFPILDLLLPHHKEIKRRAWAIKRGKF